MDVETMPRKLWEHPDPQSTAMWRFMQEANQRYHLNLRTFQDLYEWSCKDRVAFYGQLWEWQSCIYEGSFTRVVDEAAPIDTLPRWFEGVRLNFTENLLWTRDDPSKPESRGTRDKEDDKVAVTEVREGGAEVRHVTWGELRRRAGELAGALRARGVRRGDRVVMVGGHSASTLVVLLACMWLGALFSSSSTDMGVGGLLQRTVQIEPKFVFFDDGALYNGKVIDLRDKIKGMMEGLEKDCREFERMVIVQRFDRPYDTSAIPKMERFEDFVKPSKTSAPPPVERIGFQDPTIIYYSSGTTGTPKAIVHGVGPLLLNLWKENALHREQGPRDVALQYTTTGWIMYLASVCHLMFGGRAVFYDGSPLVPDAKVLLRVAADQGVTTLGISPRWMGELLKGDVVPREEFDLSRLRRVVSTGMVLSDQLFEWFYDVGFPKSVHLCNISGGTDIVSLPFLFSLCRVMSDADLLQAGCFVIENPLTPVYVGGTQGGGLGVPIAVFDHDIAEGSEGKALPPGTPGDLVATAAFPNTPVYLWNDGPPSQAPGPKYRSAYFSRYSHAWAQGDFCAVHPKTGGVYMLGRSDGVLNPSGVRFGSSDIYAVVEKHFGAEIRESICVGQRREKDLDERVFLFLLMRDEKQRLDAKLVRRIREAIARELTKRHVPRYIFEVPEIPVTVNGKKVELPVKHIISGRNIKVSGTLLNPASLEFFYRFQNVERLSEPQAKL